MKGLHGTVDWQNSAVGWQKVENEIKNADYDWNEENANEDSLKIGKVL